MPLYALGVAASFVVPRRNDLWAFGCGPGIGEGALPLFELARASNPAATHVWLAKDSRDLAVAESLGVPAVLKSSLRGFVTTLRARVIVVTHGLGDANRFATRGAFVVQLWHGIPLKLINLDSPVTSSSANGFVSKLLQRLHRLAASTIAVVPAASELSASRLRSAFGLARDRVVVTGDPRDDVVVSREPAAARAALLAALKVNDDGRRIVLYAPTWRDGAADPGVPTAVEWERIERWLDETRSLLVVRPHPLGVGDYASARADVLLLPSTVVTDITPLLPAVDLLITDYSSIAFDFALTGGPIAFLAPDLESYEASRGLYEPYPQFSGGTESRSWGELIEFLADTSVLDRLAAHSARLAARHHEFRDGKNTARVYDEITRRLKVATMTSSISLGSIAPDVVVDALEFHELSMLELSGELALGEPSSVTLRGSRLTLAAELSTSNDRWTARFDLRVSRWGGPALAPPSGTYAFEVSSANGSGIAAISASLPAPKLIPGLLRLTFAQDAATAGLAVTLAAPLTDAELGPDAQTALEKRYRAARPQPEPAVFFESFYGQNSSCNPRAIDRALAATRPEIRRYWSTVDASVEIPDGSIRVVEGSEEWWRVRASSRVLVVNDWLRKRYRKRSHQKVLQTWHGTPLKKIALGRPRLGIRPAIATLLESARWNYLLAQNPHTAAIMRKAYAYRGPIWQEGYPRDDVLAGSGSAVAASIRSRLGIAEGTTVVLYAPTWRDNDPGHIDHLDVAAFTTALGPGYLTLIRGHSRSLRPGRNLHAPNVIDVTGYPDVSELFLVADALITDYSSVMFDFSVTGKPIFFYAPDLTHYREQLRGFYLDLDEIAIGPVVQDPASLVDVVSHREQIAGDYRERYTEWQARFNPRDDGAAGERVVARMIAEGLLD